MKSPDAVAPRILVADDQEDVLSALRLLLKSEGYRTETVNSPAKALAALEHREFDAVLIDLNYARDTTSGQEGLALLARIQALDSTLPVVVMTAWANVDLAVEAMRAGARDFIQKPWDNARLLAILQTQVELARALRRGKRLEAENEILRQAPAPAFIADSPAMRPVVDLIRCVGPSEANVLITGENGTGKGLVARALHAASPRSGKSLVTVNMGGLSEGVFESELFGHIRGAFTDAKTDRVGRFELAQGGTLFLDEIANIPLKLQNRAAAGARNRRIRARRFVQDPAGRCPAHLRHQRETHGRDCRRQVQTGPAIPAEYGGDSGPGLARPAGGHPCPGGAIFSPNMRTVTRKPWQGSNPRRCNFSSSIPGRATFANWITLSSGPPS